MIIVHAVINRIGQAIILDDFRVYRYLCMLALQSNVHYLLLEMGCNACSANQEGEMKVKTL